MRGIGKIGVMPISYRVGTAAGADSLCLREQGPDERLANTGMACYADSSRSWVITSLGCAQLSCGVAGPDMHGRLLAGQE